MTEVETLVGWFLVGPMVSVCLDEAESEQAAAELVSETVVSVLPLAHGKAALRGQPPPACMVCGRALA